jgi:hypothetical protein
MIKRTRSLSDESLKEAVKARKLFFMKIKSGKEMSEGLIQLALSEVLSKTKAKVVILSRDTGFSKFIALVEAVNPKFMDRAERQKPSGSLTHFDFLRPRTQMASPTRSRAQLSVQGRPKYQFGLSNCERIPWLSTLIQVPGC